MSNRIELTLRPSLSASLLAGTPWAALIVATIVLGATGTPLTLGLTPLALAGLIRQVRLSGLLRGAHAINRLEVSNDLLWAHFGNGRRCEVRPAADSRISGRMVLLKLAFPTARYKSATVILMGDMALRGNVQPEPFRQLRVWLRLAR